MKQATIEPGCYIGIGFILAVALYIWITPVMPFSGTMENKTRWASGRKTKVITYYLIIDGEKWKVSEGIYDIAKKGDTVRHPPLLQVYEINGRPYVADSFAENTGFWLGIIFILCLTLCGDAYYRRLAN